MSTDPTRAAPAHQAQAPRPLSPDDLRAVTFDRAPFGRRGFDEYAVVRCLDRVADEIATRDRAIARLLHENRKLKHALREWHREMVGYDGVDLVALAQQEIEAQIAQTDAYSREREEEAARLYDEIVAEAYDEAEQRLDARLADGGHDQALRQRTLIVALLQSLEALATQVDATRHAFTFEVDKLEILDPPDRPDALPTVSPSDQPAQPTRPDRLHWSEQLDHRDRPEQPDQRDQADWPARAEQPDRPDRPDWTEPTDRADQPELSDRPNQDEQSRPDRSGAGAAGRTGSGGGTEPAPPAT